MAYWKFTCTWDTERECMIRRLFGNHGKTTVDGDQLEINQYAQKYTEVQGISVNDQLKNKGNTIIDYP